MRNDLHLCKDFSIHREFQPNHEEYRRRVNGTREHLVGEERLGICSVFNGVGNIDTENRDDIEENDKGKTRGKFLHTQNGCSQR